MGDGPLSRKLPRKPPSCRGARAPDRVEFLYLLTHGPGMALFFDQKWFNRRLDEAGLTKAALAEALGLSGAELEAMWKDQREILDREIGTMALLLGVSEAEVRKRGGVQGSAEARAALRAKREDRAPVAQDTDQDTDIETRLTQLEARLAEIERHLKDRN